MRSFDPILTQDPRVGYRRRFDVSAPAGTRSSTFDDVSCGRMVCSGGRGCLVWFFVAVRRRRTCQLCRLKELAVLYITSMQAVCLLLCGWCGDVVVVVVVVVVMLLLSNCLLGFRSFGGLVWSIFGCN